MATKPRVVLGSRRARNVTSAGERHAPTTESVGEEREKVPQTGKGNIPPSKGGIVYSPPTAGEVGKLEEVVALANKLSAADKQKLLATLAYDSQVSNIRGDRDLEMWSTAVYDRLATAIGAGVGAIQGPGVLRRLLGTTSNWGRVKAFMASAKLADLTVTQRQAAYLVLADLLVKHAHGVARHARAPLSAKFVANCSGDIAAIFDNAFPGYVRAGFAPLVMLRHAEHGTRNEED